MNLRDITEISAVHTWREFGDVETLVTVLESLDGRAPTQELLEAVIAALRGLKPQKRSRRVAERNRDIWLAVRSLRKIDDLFPTLEHVFQEVGRVYSLSDHTIETIYKKREREIKTRRKTKKG